MVFADDLCTIKYGLFDIMGIQIHVASGDKMVTFVNDLCKSAYNDILIEKMLVHLWHELEFVKLNVNMLFILFCSRNFLISPDNQTFFWLF